MSDILNESSNSRKYAISLRHLDYSGDLGGHLQKHSKKLERIYEKLQDLSSRDVKVAGAYTKFYDVVDSMHAWYEKAEAGKPLYKRNCWPFGCFSFMFLI